MKIWILPLLVTGALCAALTTSPDPRDPQDPQDRQDPAQDMAAIDGPGREIHPAR